MPRRFVSLSFVLVAAATSLTAPAMADEAKGLWLREGGAARVKIASCGADLCGTVVWLKNTDGAGKIGERVFFGMKPSGPGAWAGSAFNPEDGHTYSGKMDVSGNQLVTTGCALGGLICKSINWSRVN